MIDVENQVFTAVHEYVLNEFPGLYLVSTYERTPAHLPAAYVIESDNAVYRRTQDSSMNENFAAVDYQVDVFSNKVQGRKAEAKAIADAIDTAFKRMGFTRTMRSQIPNMDDATIYRIVMRYRGVVGKDGLVYAR